MKIEEKILFNEIKNQNRKVFEALFREYFFFLTRFAEGYVFDKQVAEDIVQNLFLYFWENSTEITIETSLKAYLYQSVKHRCLNHLRDLQVQDKYNLLYMEAVLNSDDPSSWHEINLTHQVQEAINSLPAKMKELFELKYLHGIKIKDIADRKGISENTIKTQLQRAKEKLRNNLTQTTSLIFFL